jgi:murein L,D-transpeptidase YcbB/YkuD
VGWGNRIGDIVKLLGFTTFTPDLRLFAQAVARWQRRNGLVADGVLGPKTWRRMGATLGTA